MERSVYRRLDELEGTHWWFRGRREIVKSVIARTAPNRNALRLLEAGCGTGGNLRMLSEFGEVDAFELDDEARAIAGRKLPIQIRDGRLPNGVPFKDQTYDVVAALDVIEHVEEDVESIAQLGRCLAPGGRLIITVPALPWMWSAHDATHHHYRRYTRKSLEAALHKAGLQSVQVSYFNTLLFPLIAGVRLVKKTFGQDHGGDDAMPPALFNRWLERIFRTERHLLDRMRLPIGVSLIAVAERPH